MTIPHNAVLKLHNVELVGCGSVLDVAAISIAQGVLQSVIVSELDFAGNAVDIALNDPRTVGQGVSALLTVKVEQARDLGGRGSADDVNVISNVVAVQVNPVDLIRNIVVDVGEAGDGLEGIGASRGASAGTNQERGVGVDNQSARSGVDLGVLVHRERSDAVELAIISNIIRSSIVVHLDSLERAVGLGGEAEQVAVQDAIGISNLVGVDVGVNVEILVLVVGLHDQCVDTSAVGNITGLNSLGSGGSGGGGGGVDIGHLADVDLSGGAVHIGDVGLCHAGTVSGVARPPDGVDDAVAVRSSDRNRTDQVVVGIEVPGVLGVLLLGLVEAELDSIVINGALNVVLLSVPVDDALSALDGSGLADDLGILLGVVEHLAADSGGVGVIGVSVDEDILILGIAIVGVVVLERQRSRSVLGIIDLEGDGGRSLDVTLSIIGDVSNVGDLGKEGVDHHDGLGTLVDLEQTALSAHLGDSVGQVDGVGRGLLLAVDDQRVSGVGLQASVVSDVALSNSLGVGQVGLLNEGGSLVAGVVGPLGGGTAPLVGSSSGSELEVLLAEAVGLGADDLIGHIAEGRGVGDLSLLDALEQELSDQLTGSGSVQVGGLRHVVQNAELLRGLRNMERPVSAGELVVLVVANRAEDHGEDLVARDVAGGLEGAVGITLDEGGVGAVADVALSPTGASHVAELVISGIEAGLIVLGDVGSVDTIDDRSYLSAGDFALGLEGTILITLEHTHAIQNGNRLSVIIADALVILEGVGADGQRQSHDQSQHHCE